MPVVYRLVSPALDDSEFRTGSGRANRWNTEGTKVIYCGATVSLCLLEMLAHLPLERRQDVPLTFRLLRVLFPDHLIDNFEVKNLPADWDAEGCPPQAQSTGDAWAKNPRAKAVLCVPSAVVEQESVYVLNPTHPRFEKIDILSVDVYDFVIRLRPEKAKLPVASVV